MPGNPFYRSKFWHRLRQMALNRAGRKCEVPGCNSTHRLTVDHIKTRPSWATEPTEFDVLGNLRVLCGTHDAKVKESAGGQRRSGGVLFVPGCDFDGNSLDPSHPWFKGKSERTA